MEKVKKEMELRNQELVNFALSRITAYDGGSAILGHVYYDDEICVEALAHVVESSKCANDVKLRTYLFCISGTDRVTCVPFDYSKSEYGEKFYL